MTSAMLARTGGKPVDDASDYAEAAYNGAVDKARAVFRGMVLVGHRASFAAGTMFWAIPGSQLPYHASTLKALDRHFRVIDAPTDGELAALMHPGNA